MPAPSATWTVPDTADWIAGSVIRKTKFLQQLLQNIYWLGTAHDHNGGAGDGGTIPTADPKAIWFYEGKGSPFA